MNLNDYHNASIIADLYGYSRVQTFLPYLRTMCTARQWQEFDWKPSQKRFSPKQKLIIVAVLGKPFPTKPPTNQPNHESED